MSEAVIQIMRYDTKTFIDAELHSDLNPITLVDTESVWGPRRRELMQKLVDSGYPPTDLPNHWHWNWGAKSQSLAFLSYRCLGIRCEGQMQGLMLVKLAGQNARLPPDTGKPLVYIDYLESAPWNVVPLVPKPLFSGIGLVLVREAVQLSVNEGFHGRIALHALPKAEAFYGKKCGMQSCGQDEDHQKLTYYEMTRQRAQEFIST